VPGKHIKKRFEILDHTADVGLIAYGLDLKQVFANAALGLSSIIVDLKGVKEVISRDVEVTAADWEELLVKWLNELIYLFDVEHILLKRAEITSLTRTRLKARVYGEKVDTSRHRLKIGVKATTYHMLNIDRDDGYKVRVLFDI